MIYDLRALRQKAKITAPKPPNPAVPNHQNQPPGCASPPITKHWNQKQKRRPKMSKTTAPSNRLACSKQRLPTNTPENPAKVVIKPTTHHVTQIGCFQSSKSDETAKNKKKTNIDTTNATRIAATYLANVMMNSFILIIGRAFFAFAPGAENCPAIFQIKNTPQFPTGRLVSQGSSVMTRRWRVLRCFPRSRS